MLLLPTPPPASQHVWSWRGQVLLDAWEVSGGKFSDGLCWQCPFIADFCPYERQCLLFLLPAAGPCRASCWSKPAARVSDPLGQLAFAFPSHPSPSVWCLPCELHLTQPIRTEILYPIVHLRLVPVCFPRGSFSPLPHPRVCQEEPHLA